MPCLVFIGIHKMAKKQTNKQKQTSTVLYSENGNIHLLSYIIAMGFFQA